MVRINNSKYEHSKRMLVVMLVFTMMLQTLIPFVQVNADTNDNCIRMLESIEGNTIFHIKENAVRDTIDIELKFAVSSRNTSGHTPLIIENDFAGKFNVVGARLINEHGVELTNVETYKDKVFAELKPEDKNDWIDEELKLIVTVKQNGLKIGETVENNFKVSFDDKTYTSNTVEIIMVKNANFDLKKTGEIHSGRNILKYEVSHKIPNESELANLGYKSKNSSFNKFKFEDKYIIGETGLYNYKNIAVFINNVDVTNEAGIIAIDNQRGKFSIEYSNEFIKNHLGEEITIKYDLSTDKILSMSALDAELVKHHFNFEGVQGIINSATLNVGMVYVSDNGTMSSTFTDNTRFTNIFNNKKDIQVTTEWPEENNKPYITKYIDGIQYTLLADGKPVETVTVDKKDSWNYTFENLPVENKNGEIIYYNVKQVIMASKGNYVTELTAQDGNFHFVNKSKRQIVLWNIESSKKGETKFETNKKLNLADREITNKITLSIPNNQEVLPFEHYKYELKEKTTGLNDLFHKIPNSIRVKVNEIDVTNEVNSVIKGNNLDIEFNKAFLEKYNDKKIEVMYDIALNDEYMKLSDIELETLLENNKVDLIINQVTVNEFYVVDDSGIGLATAFNTLRSSFSYNSANKAIDIPVKKTWIGDKLSLIEVFLYADDEIVGVAVLDETNNWEYVFTSMPEKNENGKLIRYEIEENLDKYADDYKVEILGDISGFEIVNTKNSKEIVEMINIPVSKQWVGAQLPNVDVDLLADGKLVETKRLSDDTNWAEVFSTPKFNDKGEIINYTVKEEMLANYKSETSGNMEDGFVITNTKYLDSTLPLVCDYVDYTPNADRLSIKISKQWIGEPAKSTEVNLLANGKIINTVKLSEENNWTEEIKNLRSKNIMGEKIIYTIKETSIPGYTSEITGNIEDGFMITSTKVDDVNIEDLTTSVNVIKQWVGEKQDKAIIHLLQNGVKVDTVDLNNSNDWKHEFEGLKVYSRNQNDELIENVYDVEEVEIEKYTTTIKKINKDFIIINVQEGEVIPDDTFNLRFNKKWIGKQLDKAEIELYVNGKYEELYVLNDNNNWEEEIKDLPVKDTNNQNINYELREIPIDGYTSKLTGSLETGFTFTNSEIIKPELTSVTVNKIWIGDKLPEVIISLIANDNSIIGNATLNENNGWSYTFDNIPLTENGNPIRYSVKENYNKDYDVEIKGSIHDGFVIQNTKKTIVDDNDGKQTSVSVRKQWQGKKGSEAQVALVANEMIINIATLNENNCWEYVFYNLPTNDKFGNPIEYSILEYRQNGYETSVSGSKEKGFVITNKEITKDREDNYRPPINPSSRDEMIDIDVQAKWLAETKEAFKVNLLADDRVIDTITLSDRNNYQYRFRNLDVYRGSRRIEYTVETVGTNDYKIEQTGNTRSGFVFLIDDIHLSTNNGETRNLIVDTNWTGETPKEIVAVLYGDGEKVDQVILNNQNNWSHVFKDLPVGGGMETILYELEVLPTDGFETEVDFQFEMIEDGQMIGFTISGINLNEATEKMANVHVRKSWTGKKLSNATIHLTKDNRIVDTIVLNNDNNWEHTFRDLPKYDETGRAFEYSIEEAEIKGYTSTIRKIEENAYLVINKENVKDTDDYETDWIPDVKTYDPGVTSWILTVIISLICLAYIEKKKHY